uniref:Uncharacterized protein n=1 Tax=Fagus sylvatica TaxID=28930 RepID=A0A2N9HMX3_FAGSY
MLGVGGFWRDFLVFDSLYGGFWDEKDEVGLGLFEISGHGSGLLSHGLGFDFGNGGFYWLWVCGFGDGGGGGGSFGFGFGLWGGRMSLGDGGGGGGGGGGGSFGFGFGLWGWKNGFGVGVCGVLVVAVGGLLLLVLPVWVC